MHMLPRNQRRLPCTIAEPRIRGSGPSLREGRACTKSAARIKGKECSRPAVPTKCAGVARE
eukprot:8048372-Alexandrium_andersonii.AAC.1